MVDGADSAEPGEAVSAVEPPLSGRRQRQPERGEREPEQRAEARSLPDRDGGDPEPDQQENAAQEVAGEGDERVAVAGRPQFAVRERAVGDAEPTRLRQLGVVVPAVQQVPDAAGRQEEEDVGRDRADVPGDKHDPVAVVLGELPAVVEVVSYSDAELASGVGVGGGIRGAGCRGLGPPAPRSAVRAELGGGRDGLAALRAVGG